MINILLCGANGKMGKAVALAAENSKDLKIAAGYDINTDSYGDFKIYNDLSLIKEDIDCIIDFSHPSCFDATLEFAKTNKIPYIICTTGLSEGQKKAFLSASEVSPVFYSANMSVGVNLITTLSKIASKVLEENFDIEIIEKHHNQKLDAPSGTALALADAISETISYNPKYTYDRHSVRKKREKEEIGIHAIRGGNIVGEHTVIFAGTDEIIEIKHSATSKEVFAQGAIRAARFMYKKAAGLYDMTDVLESEI